MNEPTVGLVIDAAEAVRRIRAFTLEASAPFVTCAPGAALEERNTYTRRGDWGFRSPGLFYFHVTPGLQRLTMICPYLPLMEIHDADED